MIAYNQACWLHNPQVPGSYVLAIRGFWGRLTKPKDFATYKEVAVYMAFMAALQRRRFDDE